jgi:hypothetical protein
VVLPSREQCPHHQAFRPLAISYKRSPLVLIRQRLSSWTEDVVVFTGNNILPKKFHQNSDPRQVSVSRNFRNVDL